MKVLLPAGWKRPKGYANGISAKGRTIFTAGAIGWDAEERIAEGGLVPQFRQALANIVQILAEDGAGPRHIVRLTCYVTDIQAYRGALKELGAAWRETIGAHYPAMAVVAVTALVEPDALVEIEAIAVVE
ncbi:MAG: RidA family protein [Sphingosinicella sp.]